MSMKSEQETAIELEKPFGEGMILQSKRPIPLRGSCSPLSRVHVQIQGKEAWGYSSAEGGFFLWLPELEPTDSTELIVLVNRQRRCYRNVAVGDVYLISGQSNMEFNLRDCVPGIELFSADDFSHIRYFQIQRRSAFGEQRVLPGNWVIANDKNAGSFSGLGMLFARRHYRNTTVPVGLVDASLGGMPIESFISRSALLGIPEYREEVLRYDIMASTAEACEEPNPKLDADFTEKMYAGIKRIFPEIPKDDGETKGFAEPDYDDSNWDTMEIPDSWTLAGHNHAGFFWFRRVIEMPPKAEMHEWTLHLGMIDKADRTYVNGKLVGSTGSPEKMDCWNTMRVYSLPKGTLKSGENQLAVWVGSLMSVCMDGGLLGPADEMYLTNESDSVRIPLTGNWRYKESFDAGSVGMEFLRTLGPGAAASLHCLYDNMINPLGNQAFNGVLFYQGECNAICTASRYETLLTTMIADWRRCLGDDRLPFFIFQLPRFGNPRPYSQHSQWALLRNAQQNVANKVDNVECIVLIDTGDAQDLHPKDKIFAAERCAEIMLAYQKNTAEKARSPQCISVEKHDGNIVLKFNGAELSARSGDELHGFAIHAENGNIFVPKAYIRERHFVVLELEADLSVACVYYAWADNPVSANLQDINNHPVGPFRVKL